MNSSPCEGASECSTWLDNDCPEGEKCTAVVGEVGSNAWDATICVEQLGAAAPGDECISLNMEFDGRDTCDEGSMCWNIHADTDLGTCVAFCKGSPGDPTYTPGFTCPAFSNGTLNLCMQLCDPLGDDCPGSQLCLPGPFGDGFMCVLDASEGTAPYGTPCEYINGCDPGLLCLEASLVPEPECVDATGCCSPVCDLTLMVTCPGMGQSCQPFCGAETPPPGYEKVGVCALPG